MMIAMRIILIVFTVLSFLVTLSTKEERRRYVPFVCAVACVVLFFVSFRVI